jgi:hypothetical protein
MKNVYLDQWIWIKMTDARRSGASDGPWADLYDLAVAAADSGRVVFPLSSAHYKELAKAPKWRRIQIAETMRAISRWHTIIGPVPALVTYEINLALDRRFGRGPVFRAPLRIFGTGFAHAFRIDQHDPIAQILQGSTDALEFHLLAQTALTPEEEASMRQHLADGAQGFVDEEARFAEGLAEERLQGGRRDDVVRAAELVALLDFLTPALLERGQSLDSIIGSDKPKQALTDFLRDVPTAWAQAEMKRVQHSDPARMWKANDHYDINAFSVALTYCDALAAEKHWAEKIARADLDSSNNCVLITEVQDLVTYLATA